MDIRRRQLYEPRIRSKSAKCLPINGQHVQGGGHFLVHVLSTIASDDPLVERIFGPHIQFLRIFFFFFFF